MNSKNYFITEAIISFLFGIVLILVPTQFLANYMVDGDNLGAVARGVARAYGGLLIGVGIIAWLNRNAQGAVRKSLLIACLVVALTAGIAYLAEVVPGNVNSTTWTTVGICAFLGTWAILLLFKSESQTT